MVETKGQFLTMLHSFGRGVGESVTPGHKAQGIGLTEVGGEGQNFFKMALCNLWIASKKKVFKKTRWFFGMSYLDKTICKWLWQPLKNIMNLI